MKITRYKHQATIELLIKKAYDNSYSPQEQQEFLKAADELKKLG